MFKKTSKSLIFFGGLLVLSLLLASCQSMLTSAAEMERSRAIEAWGANLTAQGESYLEEMDRQKAVDAWGAYITALGESYLEEMEQKSAPLTESSSGVPLVSEIMVDSYKPGIEIQQTQLAANTYLVVYSVKSDRPAWVVFHKDDNGSAGAILQYIFVDSGTHRIVRTEVLGKMRAEQVHVMLHEDLGTIGLFEFPGPDGPTLVDNEIVNELCFCPF